MAKSLKKGLLITFEGTEGSGKSTQSRMLADFLRRKGFKVLRLREPGSTTTGEEIRKILLNPRSQISAECETMLYMAARAQLVEEKIRPALKKKMVVLCDRFADATICYQGYGLGINLKLIESLNNFATSSIRPDITFFLDLAVRKGLRRSIKVKGFADRIERRSYNFHRKVRNGYTVLIKRFPHRIKRIRAGRGSKDQTQQIIRKAALDALARYQGSGKSG